MVPGWGWHTLKLSWLRKEKIEFGGLCSTGEVFAPDKKNGKWINSVLRTSYMTEMVGGLKFQKLVLMFTHIIGGDMNSPQNFNSYFWEVR